MTTMYLAVIEFRYPDLDRNNEPTSRSRVLTIGVYADINDAYMHGNAALEKLEARFKLNPHNRRRDRFSKNGGPFGTANHLISNIGYLVTPFDFYAKITPLNFGSVDGYVDDVMDSVKRVKAYKADCDK